MTLSESSIIYFWSYSIISFGSIRSSILHWNHLSNYLGYEHSSFAHLSPMCLPSEPFLSFLRASISIFSRSQHLMPAVFDVDRISSSFTGLFEPCRRFDALASLLFGWLTETGLPFSSLRHITVSGLHGSWDSSSLCAS